MVQKGKFSAGTEELVKALKKVDFPMLGTPRMPTNFQGWKGFDLSVSSFV